MLRTPVPTSSRTSCVVVVVVVAVAAAVAVIVVAAVEWSPRFGDKIVEIGVGPHKCHACCSGNLSHVG